MDTDVFFFSLPLVVPSQGLPQDEKSIPYHNTLKKEDEKIVV